MTQEAALTAPIGHILPFMFDNMPVRGMVLRMNNIGEYIPSLKTAGEISHILTEMLAANATLVDDLKHQAAVTLQIHSQSKTPLLVSQCDKNGGMRAYVNMAEGVEQQEGSYKDILSNNAMFAVSVEQHGKRYQSLIALHEDSVAVSIEQYFNTSVQLPTYFRVFTDSKKPGICGAIFLQAMPSKTPSKDDWQRLAYILDTITLDEALPGKVSDKDLLRRLFAEDAVRVFDQRNLNITMPNIKARMEKALHSIGPQQAKELLEEGPIEMTCEFSGQSFTFNEEHVRNIFGTLWEEESK